MKKGLLSKSAPMQKPSTQDQYDMFVAHGMNVVHDDKISDSLIQKITKHQDPIDAIAEATLEIVARLENSAEEQGGKLDENVILQGANIVMGEIMGLAEAAGMKPLTDEEKYQAFSLAVSMYLDNAVKSGKMTPEQLTQMGQQMSSTPEGQKIAQQLKAGGGVPQPGPTQPSVPQLQGRM